MTLCLKTVVRVMKRLASKTSEGYLKELMLFNLKMRLQGAVTAVLP